MPVFGIVPYRTEARTRSEARTQEAVDRLLLILKTVNEVIRTAEGRLIELFRPPPVVLGLVDPGLWISAQEVRANNRTLKIVPYTNAHRYKWGDAVYELARERICASWGTIQ